MYSINVQTALNDRNVDPFGMWILNVIRRLRALSGIKCLERLSQLCCEVLESELCYS